MKKSITLMIAGALALSAQVSMAAVKAGEMSLSPMIGGFVFDSKEKVDRNALVGGLRAGYNFTQNIGVEALFDYANTQTRNIYGNKDADMYRYGAEALYNFFPDSRFVPHVAVGAGAMNLKGGGLSNKAKTMLDAGFGAKYFLTDSVALRGDVRYIPVKDARWNSDFEYLVGLYIPFGGTKAAAKPVEPAPVEPAPAPVAKPAEPAPVAKPVEPAPVVKPVEPAPVPAPPVDSDRDGVIDPLDKCPDTPAGTKVDANGCPVPVEVAQPKTSAAAEHFCSKPAVLNIKFDTNKSVVKPEYAAELKTLSDFLKEFPQAKGEISGYTDSVGSKAVNLKLSQARAESVRTYIINNFGIDGSRITAKGYGPDKPIASNKTAVGKAKNRRIEAAFSCE